MRHCRYRHFCFFCRSTQMQFLPRSLTAALFRSLCSHKRSWQNHILFSRSFSCNRLLGNKKAGTSRWYVPTENSQTSPLFRRRVITSKCNRLCNSKSKLPFTLVCCRQFIAIQRRRCFRLAHRSVVRLQVVRSKTVWLNMYSVMALLREYFIILQETSVCQYFCEYFFGWWEILFISSKNRADKLYYSQVHRLCKLYDRLLDTVVCKSFTSIKYSCLHFGQ